MSNSERYTDAEHGGAATKFLIIFFVLALIANAGYNYIPVAYDAAGFRQEMDTAVVKGLAASGAMKPLQTVTASMQRAISTYNVPHDAVVEIKPAGAAVIEVHVSYSKQVDMLPFGLYKYTYNFEHTATPSGYLTKQ